MTREQFEQALIPCTTSKIVVSPRNIEQIKKWYGTGMPEEFFTSYKGIHVMHNEYIGDNIIICLDMNSKVIHATNVEKVKNSIQ